MAYPGLDLDNIFTYHQPHGDQAARYDLLRQAAKRYAAVILAHTPSSPEQTFAHWSRSRLALARWVFGSDLSSRATLE